MVNYRNRYFVRYLDIGRLINLWLWKYFHIFYSKHINQLISTITAMSYSNYSSTIVEKIETVIYL